ncbi:ATP-binding protein [Sphaerisporangium sp. NPDC049003]|uniref:ATP-binding protein n=1 Tax=Sphaerisporangium sp. NPDC049003 TaxID=3364517 RepID=UPI00371B527E
MTVKEARDFATHTMRAWGVTARVEDIRLCVSELTTNALAHGAVAGQGFVVKMKAAPGMLRIEVHDSSNCRPELREPEDTETSGRGLLMITVLSDDWGIEDRHPFGKIVWSVFKLDESPVAFESESTGDPS